MEDFQQKINQMKKKIDNIRSDIESIKVESSHGTNTPKRGHRKTNLLNDDTNSKYLTNQPPSSTLVSYNGTINNDDESVLKNQLLYPNKVPKATNVYTPYKIKHMTKGEVNNNNYNFNYHLQNNHSTKHKNVPPKLQCIKFGDYLEDQLHSVKSNSNHPTNHNSFRLNNNNHNQIQNPNLNIHKRNKTLDSKEKVQAKTQNSNRNKISSSRYSITRDINYEQIINELIDISNEFYEDEDISPSLLVEIYKRTLRENKMKNEFISQLVELYNSKTNSEIKGNSNEALIHLWKWIKSLTKDKNYEVEKSYQIPKKIESPNIYQTYCEKIMKEYKIKSLNEFSSFIEKLLKKANKNDSFLEGIKKILLTEHKIEEY